MKLPYSHSTIFSDQAKDQGHPRFPLPKLLKLCYKKTKGLLGLLTLKQEMETDDDNATIRESFSLVQSIILFIEFTDIPPAH